MSGWLRARSALDRVLAALALVPAAPVIGVVAALVARTGRPAIITVPRIGQGGRPFRMLKLRTMRVGGPGGLAGGAALTAGDDDRVTPLGRHLRRWRLDELPQLVNVVRGDMALLGPRPEAPEYVDLADPRWQRVLAARPGIAGASQALVHRWEASAIRADDGDQRYRETVLPVKLALDEWYVSSATPRLDALVIAALVGSGRSLRAQVHRCLPGCLGPLDG